jgi:hydrogenase maturation protein HypF
MAISYLYDAFDRELWNLDLPLIKEIDDDRKQIILQMITKRVNSPLTSSLGRLFDGVSAIMGIRNKVSFEGQAAMELEMMADEGFHASYEYGWSSGDPIQIPTAPIIRGVVEDIINKRGLAEISAKFHNTLTALFSDLCDNIKKDIDLNRVVMSGGVFQNSILLAGLIKSLKARGFEVFAHSMVPTNDGGICLGQAVVAAARVRN